MGHAQDFSCDVALVTAAAGDFGDDVGFLEAA